MRWFRDFIGRRRASIVAVVAVASLGLVAPAHALDLVPTASSFEPAGEKAAAPDGWTDFCERYDAVTCEPISEAPRDIDVTDALWSRLVGVNSWVNAWVKPESDMKHWGVADRWDYPLDGFGDCEDDAILKQFMLISMGVPREDLLLTVVWARGNEGHALLTVHTNQGDFVLDNQRNEIVPWSQSGYGYVKRQSRTDPNRWIYIDGASPAQPLVVSSSGE